MTSAHVRANHRACSNSLRVSHAIYILFLDCVASLLLCGAVRARCKSTAMDKRSESVDSKIQKLDKELMRYTEQMKKMKPVPQRSR